MNRVLFGIHLDSKLAGTTVLSVFDHAKVYFFQVDQNVDADEYISKACQHFKPELTVVDAPLSLPGVYQKLKGFSDYHRRQCDRDLKLCSPLIQGGLLARAMELKDKISCCSAEVIESSPRSLAKALSLNQLGYKGSKTNLITCRTALLEKMNPQIIMDCQDVTSWHHLDAWLCLLTALRRINGSAESFGNPNEALVWV